MEKAKYHWEFSCQKIPRFQSHRHGPECPPGDLNIINSGLPSKYWCQNDIIK